MSDLRYSDSSTGQTRHFDIVTLSGPLPSTVTEYLDGLPELPFPYTFLGAQGERARQTAPERWEVTEAADERVQEMLAG